MPDLLGFGKGFRLLNYVNKRQPEKTKSLGIEPNDFFLLDGLVLASQLRYAPQAA